MQAVISSSMQTGLLYLAQILRLLIWMTFPHGLTIIKLEVCMSDIKTIMDELSKSEKYEDHLLLQDFIGALARQNVRGCSMLMML